MNSEDAPLKLRLGGSLTFSITSRLLSCYSFNEQLQSAAGTCAFRKSATRL
jgi:hypothetical protein